MKDHAVEVVDSLLSIEEIKLIAFFSLFFNTIFMFLIACCFSLGNGLSPPNSLEPHTI